LVFRLDDLEIELFVFVEHACRAYKSSPEATYGKALIIYRNAQNKLTLQTYVKMISTGDSWVKLEPK